MALSKEDILEAQDIQTDTVDVPEWGGTVHVRALNAVERGKLDNLGAQARLDGTAQLEDMHVMTVQMGVIDDDGQRVFSEDDIPELREKAAAPMERISERIWEMSGISEEDVEDAVEDLEQTPSGDSGTN